MHFYLCLIFCALCCCLVLSHSACFVSFLDYPCSTFAVQGLCLMTPCFITSCNWVLAKTFITVCFFWFQLYAFYVTAIKRKWENSSVFLMLSVDLNLLLLSLKMTSNEQHMICFCLQLFIKPNVFQRQNKQLHVLAFIKMAPQLRTKCTPAASPA